MSRPVRSSATRSSVTTTAPRATLTSTAPTGRRARKAASTQAAGLVGQRADEHDDVGEWAAAPAGRRRRARDGRHPVGPSARPAPRQPRIRRVVAPPPTRCARTRRSAPAGRRGPAGVPDASHPTASHGRHRRSRAATRAADRPRAPPCWRRGRPPHCARTPRPGCGGARRRRRRSTSARRAVPAGVRAATARRRRRHRAAPTAAHGAGRRPAGPRHRRRSAARRPRRGPRRRPPTDPSMAASPLSGSSGQARHRP